MTIIIPPGFAHVDVSHRHISYQRDAHVTFGVDVSGSDLDPPDDFAEELGVCWEDTFASLIDSQVGPSNIEVRIGQDGSDPVIGVSTWGGGSRSGDSISPGNALGIRKRTGLGGRRNSGRFFLPWAISDGNVNEVGIISAGYVATAQERADAFAGVFGGAVAGLVLLHRTGGSPVPDPTPVTTLQVDQVVSSQRRRQLRNPS